MSSNSICNSSDDFHKIKISRPIYWTHEFVNKCQVDLDDEPMCNQFGNTIKKACSVQKVINFVSFINMIRNYKIKSYLWNDIIAGMTVAFMQLPQGIGYAALSGLPAVIGMYMGFFPHPILLHSGYIEAHFYGCYCSSFFDVSYFVGSSFP